MADIKEMIEQEIRSYKRDRDTADKEAIKKATMRDCYSEFVGVLETILSKMEQEEANG